MKKIIIILIVSLFITGCETEDYEMQYQVYNPSEETVVIDVEYLNIETEEYITENNISIEPESTWNSPLYLIQNDPEDYKITAYRVSGKENLWFYVCVNGSLYDQSWCPLQYYWYSSFYSSISENNCTVYVNI